MENRNFKFAFLSGNMLKIIAAICMALDHIGLMLFPHVEILRIIGRISLPIFAFMIAEGCKYTKNKLRYFLMIFGLGAIFQIVYYIVDKSLYMGILITFSISILMIYALMWLKNELFKEKKSIIRIIVASLVFVLSIVTCYFLNKKFVIDYGFYGCLMALFASVFHHDSKGKYNNKVLKKLDNIPLNVFMLSIGILLLALHRPVIQFYSFLAVPILLLYSGKKGKYNMKYFFYIFYPAHLVILFILEMLL